MVMAQSRGKSSSRRKTGGKRSAKSGSTLWPWLAALALVAGGIALYDNSTGARRFIAGLTAEKPVQTASKTEQANDKPVPPRPLSVTAHRPVTLTPGTPPDQSHTAAIIPPAPIGRPGMDVVSQSAAPSKPDEQKPGEALAGAYQAKFYLCGTAKQDDCVMAPDRFMFHGQKIRLVGIEVPDIKKPRCESERIKASDAELRVRAFLDSGPFELVTWQGNGAEIEGHKLRDVTRNGRSLADILVNEGLAKRPGAGKGGWC
jgi:endonuclease YncB( thermonuclease family)